MAEKKKAEKSDKDRILDGEILARIVIEVAGAPKEHINQVITKISDKIEALPYVTKLESEEIFEAEEVDDTQKGVFSSVSDLTLWVKSVDTLVEIAFGFMPASIEIIEPSELSLENKLASTFFNELLAKMHAADMIAKNANAKSTMLERRFNILLRNFVLSQLHLGPRSLEELSLSTGISSEQLKSFMDLLDKDKETELKNKKYVSLKKQLEKKTIVQK